MEGIFEKMVFSPPLLEFIRKYYCGEVCITTSIMGKCMHSLKSISPNLYVNIKVSVEQV